METQRKRPTLSIAALIIWFLSFLSVLLLRELAMKPSSWGLMEASVMILVVIGGSATTALLALFGLFRNERPTWLPGLGLTLSLLIWIFL